MITNIVSYKNPDMDGVAAMVALKELSQKQGKQSIEYYIDDKPQMEVQLVLKKYGITLLPVESISTSDDFILVDCNDLGRVHKVITPQRIIEVIDHHSKSEELKNFTRAKIDIQKVGAVATLIVERFMASEITPSLESAILLYHAIASNTINLKGDVTTERDLQAFNWLQGLYSKLSQENIDDIFKQKSQVDNIEQAVLSDLKVIGTPKGKVVIAQLELANATEFCDKNIVHLRRIIDEISSQTKTENIMLNVIDIINGFNVVLCRSQELRNRLAKIGLKFNNDIAITKKIIMRKQFVSLLSN